MPVSSLILQSLPFLQSLPQVTIDELSKQSNIKEFSKREVVIAKGTAPQRLYFLITGRLQGVDFTMDGKEVGTAFSQPTDFFGELSLVDGELQADTVLAIAKSQVVMIPQGAIRPLLATMPNLAWDLVLRLSQKLREAQAQRRILGLTNPLQKVSAQLSLLWQRSTNSTTIEDMPTHQELAIMVNASRETVTRVFQMLIAKRLVVREGSCLNILEPQVLTEIAEGTRESP